MLDVATRFPKEKVVAEEPKKFQPPPLVFEMQNDAEQSAINKIEAPISIPKSSDKNLT